MINSLDFQTKLRSPKSSLKRSVMDRSSGFLVPQLASLLVSVAISIIAHCTIQNGLVLAQQRNSVPTESAFAPSPSIEPNVESLIAGLDDKSYRVRRESFLALCDSKLKIESWIDEASSSKDKHRSAIALWLKKLRRTDGSIPDRAMLIRDYELLLAEDDSVIERYINNNQWDRLIDLVAALPIAIRYQVFSEAEHRLQPVITQAWSSGNEQKIPKLLELILTPTAKVVANHRWEMLGMPEEWHLTESETMPSVSVVSLDLQGKGDEAIALARSKGLSNWMESLYVRNARWDEWLKLDEAKTPVVFSENIAVQRVAVLMSLGRFDDAIQMHQSFVGEAKKSGEAGARNRAYMSILVGDEEELENCLKDIPSRNMFYLDNLRLRFRSAFGRLGLNDLSVSSVKQWVANAPKALIKNDEVDLRAVDSIRCASSLRQLGLTEQAMAIDDAILEANQSADKVSAYEMLLKLWTLDTHQRARVIALWKKHLAKQSERQSDRQAKDAKRRAMFQGEANSDPFREVVRLLFPNIKDAYRLIYKIQLEKELKSPAIDPENDSETDRRKQAISRVVDTLDDLNEGRKPKSWTGNAWLESLKEQVDKAYQIESESGESDTNEYSLALCFADIADAMGEPQLALQFLDHVSPSEGGGRFRAHLYQKLGEHALASQMLLKEFQSHAYDLSLLNETIDGLNKIGRWNEANRVRLQGLSSTTPLVMNGLRDSELAALPVRSEIQFVMEQAMERANTNFLAMAKPVEYLRQQAYQSALQDLSYAAKAAHYSRIELLVQIKTTWGQDSAFADASNHFEQALAGATLEAIANKDRALADRLFRKCQSVYPTQIETPITLVPVVEKVFGKEVADEWFAVYWEPLTKHLVEFPNDTLIGNNTAWLAAKCKRELPRAHEMASHVVELLPDPTYIDTLAEIEFQLGNVEKALELSQKCRDVDPRDKQHRNQVKRFLSALLKNEH